MNNLNFYSFIKNFDDFIECINGIDIIEFGNPPTQFNHWCYNSGIEMPSPKCLDCCYIRKYHVRDYYIIIHKDKFYLYDNTDLVDKLECVCLLFHFKTNIEGKKCVYISFIESVANNEPEEEEYIIETYFNEKSIRYILSCFPYLS